MFAQPSQPPPNSFSTPSSTTGSPSKESYISFRASMKPGKINLVNLLLLMVTSPLHLQTLSSRKDRRNGMSTEFGSCLGRKYSRECFRWCKRRHWQLLKKWRRETHRRWRWRRLLLLAKYAIVYGACCICFYINIQLILFTGWPVMLNINLAADTAISASIAEMNERSLAFSLYRATYKDVIQIKQVDFNTYDLIINFGIRETMCLKPLTVSLDRCQFKWGLSKVKHKTYFSFTAVIRINTNEVIPM
ncbi:uncharacterized protein LOC113654236 [Tachysurus fulvidraco]|uniref:uncharacterized protein LOC113654236 n=1 Tax=Tachysurus fulvidraco TaxID=1234273 RepID=UPI001FED8ED4|nr:uncharacterized protein LOC113654236 [Tachysurus fulvidraco]